MKLSRVEITHFRCFEHLSLDLDPHINVLVGANGSGKSTVLDGIAAGLYHVVLANGGGAARRGRGRSTAALRPHDIHVDPRVTDKLKARKDYVQFRVSAADYYPVGEFSGKTSVGDPQHLEWSDYVQYVPPGGFQYDSPTSLRTADVRRYFQGLWNEIRKSTSAAQIPLPVVAYYRAQRRMGDMPVLGELFATDFSRESAHSGALDAGANFQAMCQWLYLRENEELRSRATNGTNPAAFPDILAIRTALGKVIENVERVFFEGTPPRLTARVRQPGSAARDLELGQLSDGYRTLLALVLDFARRLAQAHPNWAAPLSAPGILLIDEVELHLHPRWQQSVLPSLQAAFPNTQIIVSTHSPGVVQTAARHQLHVLDGQHAKVDLPANFDPLAAEHSAVLQEVFGTAVRPLTLEARSRVHEYLELINTGNGETERAAKIGTLLADTLGTKHPELVRCEAARSRARSAAESSHA
jgi:predicted ATP-binding protein involved in virulence